MASFSEIDKDLQERLDNIEAIKGIEYRKLLQIDITLGSAFIAMRKLISSEKIPAEIKGTIMFDILASVHMQVLNELADALNKKLNKEELIELHEDAKRIVINTREHVLNHLKECGL